MNKNMATTCLIEKKEFKPSCPSCARKDKPIAELWDYAETVWTHAQYKINHAEMEARIKQEGIEV